MPMLAPCRQSRQRGGPLLAALAGLLLAIAPVSSAAQPSSAHVDDLLKRGNTALRGKRPLEALAAWHAAWSLKPSHRIACNIGHAERIYGSARAAAEFLSICLRISPAPTTPEDKKRRAQFEEDLRQAQAQVSVIIAEANQDGASILIDDRRVGTSPLPDPVFVEPGKHTLSATLEGFERADLEVTVEEGAKQKAQINLKKAAPLEKESVPPPLLPLAPLARKARAPSVAAPLSKAVIAGGTSFATLGFGLGAGLLIARAVAVGGARDSREEVRLGFFGDCAPSDASESVCSEYLSLQRDRATMRSIATVSFVSAGLAAAATVAYVLFPRSPVVPSIGKGEGVKVTF